MKKRLFSLFLALSLTCSAASALAADIKVSDTEEVFAVGYSASQDPEAYRALHKKAEKPAKKSGTSLSNASIASIYTGKYYSVPSVSNIKNGIDVSKWDNYINWSKVKNAGTDFAIVRCGYRGYGNGSIGRDPTYATNMKNAAAAGVPTGVYIFSQARTEAEAREEARYCLNSVQGYSIKYPIVMDVEYAESGSGYTGRLYNAGLSRDALTKICLAFCETIEEAGYTPMIYANTSMLNNKMYPSQISAKYPIWLANYTTRTSYTGDYTCWQYSESGRVPGISTAVDCNFFFGNPASGSYTHPATQPSASIACTGISLDKTSVSASLDDVISLTASKQPYNTTDKTQWVSSNTDVARVSSDGTVTVVGAGNAVITASAGNYSASCNVSAVPYEASISRIKVADNGGYTLSFFSDGAESYDIYRSDSGADNSFYKIGSTADETYTDTSAVSNHNYFYRVAGTVTAPDGSVLSSEASNTVRTDYIPQPAVLTSISRYSTRKIRLKWENAYGASSYYIYRSTTGVSGKYKLINVVSNRTVYTSSNLTVGKAYSFYIRPYMLLDDVKYIGKASQPLSIVR